MSESTENTEPKPVTNKNTNSSQDENTTKTYSRQELFHARKYMNNINKNIDKKIIWRGIGASVINTINNILLPTAGGSIGQLATSMSFQAANTVANITYNNYTWYQSQNLSIIANSRAQQDYDALAQSERTIMSPEKVNQIADRMGGSAVNYLQAKVDTITSSASALISFGLMFGTAYQSANLPLFWSVIATAAGTVPFNIWINKKIRLYRIRYRGRVDKKMSNYNFTRRQLREKSNNIEACNMQNLAYDQLEMQSKIYLKEQETFSKKMSMFNISASAISYLAAGAIATAAVSLGSSVATAATLSAGTLTSIGSIQRCLTSYIQMKEFTRSFANAFRQLKQRFKDITFGNEQLKSNANAIQMENISYHHHTNSGSREEMPLFSSRGTYTFQKGISVLSGASGAGKSTLIRLLLQGDFCNGGSLKIGSFNNKGVFKGTDYYNLARKEVFKSISVPCPPVNFNITVDEYIKCYTNVPEKQVQYIKNLCGIGEEYGMLNEKTNLSTAKLSAGEKQRIGLAQALLRNTPILILDEALVNIDSARRQKIIDYLNELSKEKTIIYISHNAEELKTLNAYQAIDIGRHHNDQKVNDIERYDLTVPAVRNKYLTFLGQRQKTEQESDTTADKKSADKTTPEITSYTSNTSKDFGTYWWIQFDRTPHL